MFYFIINIDTDLTDKMIDQAEEPNAFMAAKTNDGQFIGLRYTSENVPSELFILGYTPYTLKGFIEEMKKPQWMPVGLLNGLENE